MDCMRTAEAEFTEHRALEHGKAKPGEPTEEVAVIEPNARVIAMIIEVTSINARNALN